RHPDLRLQLRISGQQEYRRERNPPHKEKDSAEACGRSPGHIGKLRYWVKSESMNCFISGQDTKPDPGARRWPRFVNTYVGVACTGTCLPSAMCWLMKASREQPWPVCTAGLNSCGV